MPSMLLRLLLALATGLFSVGASAQATPAVSYRVQVEGPKALVDLLQDGLDIVRWQQDPEMNAELLERLLEEAVREAREAVATEGYFSAQVKGSIDRTR
jgi:hypothetical protein